MFVDLPETDMIQIKFGLKSGCTKVTNYLSEKHGLILTGLFTIINLISLHNIAMQQIAQHGKLDYRDYFYNIS